MKIVKYLLNIDGTIPEYIIDGGYFPVESGLDWPHDYYLIGISEQWSKDVSFASVEDLISYLDTCGTIFMELSDPLTLEIMPIDTTIAATDLWNKLV